MKRPLRYAVGTAGAVIALAAAGGVAYAVYAARAAKPASCQSMAAAAAQHTDIEPQDVLVQITGNTASVAEEARQFTTDAVVGTDAPGSQVAVRVTLMLDGSPYAPEESDCFGTVLLISGNSADVASYRAAEDRRKAQLGAALQRDQTEQVALIGDAVLGAALGSPPPAGPTEGAFSVWHAAAELGGGERLSILASFPVGGANCLTVDDPAFPTATGRTVIDERVAECVSDKQVPVLTDEHLTVTGVAALGLDPGQAKAQEAVIDSLCAQGAEHHCTN